MGILSTIPISETEFEIVSAGLQRYPVLSTTYLRNFERLWGEGKLTREYPLVEAALQYVDGPNDYFEQIAQLILFHQEHHTPGLTRVLSESENKIDFFHSLSQLELGRAFLGIGFEVELDDDLVLRKGGNEIFAEIKTFQEDEHAGLVITQLAPIDSNYYVEIVHQLTTTPQAERLVATVRERLSDKTPPAPFSISMPGSDRPFAHVTFTIKRAGDNPHRTGIVIRNSEAIEINEDDNVTAISRQLIKASEQLIEDYETSPKFIIFDIVNSNQNLLHSKRADFFRKILYGSRCMLGQLDRSLQPRSIANSLTDEELIAIQQRNIQDIIRDYGLVALNQQISRPGFSQTVDRNLISKQVGDGLTLQYSFLQTPGEFFRDEFAGVNGVLVRTLDGLHILLNPFVNANIMLDEPTIIQLFGIGTIFDTIEVAR